MIVWKGADASRQKKRGEFNYPRKRNTYFRKDLLEKKNLWAEKWAGMSDSKRDNDEQKKRFIHISLTA